MSTMSVRLDDWLKAEIEEFWRVHGERPSTGLRYVAEEWWTMQRFHAIAFRDGVSGRRAYVRGGPDVWEIVTVARDYGDDRDGFYEHFSPFVARELLDQALAYAQRFPERVATMIERNRRMERVVTGEG
jgi:hypothetical protein